MTRAILQAITVQLRPPTEKVGPRVKVECQTGDYWFPRQTNLDDDQNAIKAARLIAKSLGWQGQYHCGIIRDGRYVFVLSSGERVMSV